MWDDSFPLTIGFSRAVRETLLCRPPLLPSEAGIQSERMAVCRNAVQLLSCLLFLQLLMRILRIQIKNCKVSSQHWICMSQYTVRTAEQLPRLLHAFRQEAKLTQSEVALRLGVSQQTYSAMERNADKVGAARLLKLLNVLGVEMALQKPDPVSALITPGSNEPVW